MFLKCVINKLFRASYIFIYLSFLCVVSCLHFMKFSNCLIRWKFVFLWIILYFRDIKMLYRVLLFLAQSDAVISYCFTHIHTVPSYSFMSQLMSCMMKSSLVSCFWQFDGKHAREELPGFNLPGLVVLILLLTTN